MRDAFDWPALLRVGLRDLRLAPGAFWALTPAEFHLMIGDLAGPAPMARDRLEALMTRFPDQTRTGGADDGPI